MTGSQRGKRKEYEKLTKTVSASESRASPATSMSLAASGHDAPARRCSRGSSLPAALSCTSTNDAMPELRNCPAQSINRSPSDASPCLLGAGLCCSNDCLAPVGSA